MSSVTNEKIIISSIREETDKLNDCIKKWYKEILPKSLNEFNGCCNEAEKNLLMECYNIFSENNNLQSLDEDFVKALIAYYYIIVVFDYDVHSYIDQKYVKMVKIIKLSEVENIKKKRVNGKEKIRVNGKWIYYTDYMMLFRDNENDFYVYYWNNARFNPHKIKNYIEICHVVDAERLQSSKEDCKKKFYLKKEKGKEYWEQEGKIDPYLYNDAACKDKFVLRNHMDCFEKKLLTNEKSKEYYNLLYKSDEDWVSEIRKLILNMNIEKFEGGKKRRMKKNTKKNKKTLKNKKSTLSKN